MRAWWMLALVAVGCSNQRQPPAPGSAAPPSAAQTPAAPPAAPAGSAASAASGGSAAPAPGPSPAAEPHEARQVAEFDAVELRGAADIEIDDGAAQVVEVTAEPDVLPLVTTDVVAHRLVIGAKPGADLHGHVTVHVGTPHLAGVVVSGSGDIQVHGAHGGTLKLGISGAGTITAEGTVDGLAVALTGAGAIHAFDLHAEHVTASVGGSGVAEVFATKALDALVSGAGSIRYAGTPADVHKTITGAGTVEPR